MDNSATESEAQARRRARTPLPGQRVRGSRTGRPIMAALDLLGRRWTLRILWELRHEALSFRMLRSRCDSMSPSVLNARLSELREAGLLATRPGEGYRLTEQGLGLLSAVAPLDDWAKGWSRIAARALPRGR
ncbi:MAG: helix-turn-helix transcriptional regulator [Chloroflexi bacterium]|nr:MAG: helix-turn-helix transcriptional regulator [Chloroflexota bacterium]